MHSTRESKSRAAVNVNDSPPLRRCGWAEADDLMRAYHDTEWGVPCRDDQELFERLLLEGFQAGLSWRTILNKRAHYRVVMDEFDPMVIARYGATKIEKLLQDPGIVRNRLKVHGAVRNAQAWLALEDEVGSVGAWLWEFAPETPVCTPRRSRLDEIPATTPESDALSRALKQRGFTFVGSTICYAFMQSVGMVDDHVEGCFRAE